MSISENGCEKCKIYLNTVLYRIKKIREDKRFPQAFMAKSLDMDESCYLKLESGTEQLSLDIVLDICVILDIKPKDVLS